ncbi:hypothetical protein [Micromonospora sp. WMMD980]|uniref:hypothetical protein n=1 Tax=Micromonospora sp. WMMD980 TaxID=3016088 RepID=UPI0024178323|nr:hypothetical protein [Micromonospora sp. WMMD980]MDG4799060.1 hypothetical protein [Micromonospora sp. WMMD980]
MATTAPETLLAARRLLLEHLGGHGLSGAAVGIVGDPAHRGGYHCGSDRVISGDYSVVESSRDRSGLAQWACALDVGAFSVATAGRRYDLPHFSAWLVSECAKGTDDTRDIREVIYSLDGRTVVRWDRLGRRRSGDDSHRWHTHISYHRDAIRAGRDQSAVIRRYLTTIGLIQATPIQEADMPLTEADANTVWAAKALEYVDEFGDGKRDARTVKDILFATHAAALAAADPTRMARAVADLIRADLAQLPPGAGLTVEQVEGATERGIRRALGSLDGATPQG